MQSICIILYKLLYDILDEFKQASETLYQKLCINLIGLKIFNSKRDTLSVC